MSSEDLSYYRQRAITERVNAKRAERQEIAEIHEELARLYDALVEHECLRPTLSTATPNHPRERSPLPRVTIIERTGAD